MFQKCENTMYLRFAHDLGSGKAKRLCANAIVAPIVSSVNVRSTDILLRETNKKQNYNYSFQEKIPTLKITSVQYGLRVSLENDFTWSQWIYERAHACISITLVLKFERKRERKLAPHRFPKFNYIYPHLFPHSLYDKHNHRFLFTFNSCIDQMQTNRARYIDDNKNYMLLFLHRI